MSGLPPALDTDHTRSLGQRPKVAATSPPRSPRAATKRQLRRAARRAAAALLPAEIGTIDAMASTRDRLDHEMSGLRSALSDIAMLSTRVHQLETNQELLKAEHRELLGRVEQLGEAMAPGAGLEVAGVRFAEIRDEVHALERRMRRLDQLMSQSGERAPATTSPDVDAVRPSETSPAVASEGFNYVAFERRFRGDAEAVLREQTERYGDLLASSPGPVLDIGCGRGELLEALADRDVPVVGVDTDAGMVAEATGRGLDVRHQDALDFLRSVEPGSLGAVFSAQVLEHLEFDYLLALLPAAERAVAPGGLFVAETPNPGTLFVLANSFIIDPTHTRALHPGLLQFLCETTGFGEVTLRYFNPVTPLALQPIDESFGPWVPSLNNSFGTLNGVLFGPQDYAVLARKAITP